MHCDWMAGDSAAFCYLCNFVRRIRSPTPARLTFPKNEKRGEPSRCNRLTALALYVGPKWNGSAYKPTDR